MIAGFTLAAYAVVANDSIQTLGTFIASNGHRPWWVLFLYSSSILVATIVVGWALNHGDPSYGRLDVKFPPFESITFTWIHLLSPLALLILTRLGYPVSTTFLILTVFSQPAFTPMLHKSLGAYVVAFAAGLGGYALLLRGLENRWQGKVASPREALIWNVLQWVSTAWLWFNWLRQDLANIYIYFPRPLPGEWLLASLVFMVGVQAIIFRSHGGKIQRVVLQKLNTTDVRSATVIDFLYGTVLWLFQELNNTPMSTTWAFIGILGGRELALRLLQTPPSAGTAGKLIGRDLAKAAAGLGVSVSIAFVLPLIFNIP